ncbi:hypothetical protein LZC95_35460 [Pendulispora brunnea]|uniref:Uncharacterized protein n=1 Tax=Pendulispora brunnea TaxID=2905690 RepID=A0ABZ2JZG6_9BACT
MHARYDPDALGSFNRPIVLRLTNAGGRPLYVEPLRVAFTASREGVPFPCREHVLGTIRRGEPKWLDPGQSFAFERDMDCTLPLPGTYQIRAFVQVGEGPIDLRPEDAADAFMFEVESGPLVPQSYPSGDGLFVIMNGRKVTRPMPPEAWARGDYRVISRHQRRPSSGARGRRNAIVRHLSQRLDTPVFGEGGTSRSAGAARPGKHEGHLVTDCMRALATRAIRNRGTFQSG